MCRAQRDHIIFHHVHTLFPVYFAYLAHKTAQFHPTFGVEVCSVYKQHTALDTYHYPLLLEMWSQPIEICAVFTNNALSTSRFYGNVQSATDQTPKQCTTEPILILLMRSLCAQVTVTMCSVELGQAEIQTPVCTVMYRRVPGQEALFGMFLFKHGKTCLEPFNPPLEGFR